MTATPDPLSLHAALHPDRPALVEDPPGGAERVWSYADVDRWAKRYASMLASKGIEPGERVAWCGPNSPSVIALSAGCRMAGVTAVPLNYRLTVDEAGYVLDNCDARLVLVDVESAPLVVAARAAAPAWSTCSAIAARRPGVRTATRSSMPRRRTRRRATPIRQV